MTIHQMPEPARRWPFDIDSLDKGDVVHASQIERAFDVQRCDVKGYQLAMMKAKERLVRAAADIRGMVWTVRQDGENLRILTDAEAISYNAAEFDRGRRRMARSQCRSLGIERINLSDDQQTELDRKLIYQATVLQAMNDASKSLAPKAHVRTLPT